MAHVRRFKVDKLIRDRLPEMMRAQGLSVFERVMTEAEYRTQLRAKLIEEAQETAAAESAADLLNELADVSEVLRALAAACGFTPADVERARRGKRRERGGFEGRIYNAAIEAPADCAALDYYLARPHAYPELAP